MKKRAHVKENAPSRWRIPPLRAADNKYTRGHVLVLGGAAMTGAARLAALAAQRAGAGMVSIACPPAVWPVYAASMLSVITLPDTSAQWKQWIADARIQAVLIGPGAGVNARTAAAIRSAATAAKTLILDADALSVLASNAALRKAVQAARKILTPHEGEYGRLAEALGLDVTADKPARAMALAKALNAVVVLKGAETIIATADGQWLVSCPPMWLASAGTGDVLAGAIAALVGQGMEPFSAAAAGVWLHAKAAEGYGHGMIAEDLIAALPAALATARG